MARHCFSGTQYRAMIRKSRPKFHQLEKRDEDVLVIVFRTCLSARFVAKSQRSIAAGLITIDGQARPSCCPLFHWTRAAFSSFSFYFSFFRVFFLFFFFVDAKPPQGREIGGRQV